MFSKPPKNLVRWLRPERGRYRHVIGRDWEMLEPRVLLSSATAGLPTYELSGPYGGWTAVEQRSPAVGHASANVGANGAQVRSSVTTLPQGPTPFSPPGGGGVPYLVVPDSPLPHSTAETAQALPDVPYYGVIGVLAGLEPTTMFLLPVSAAGSMLQINVRVEQPAGGSGESVWLTDSDGRVLVEQTLSAVSEASIENVAMTFSNASGPVYLGISGSTSAQAPTGFQAWVANLGPTGSQSSESFEANPPGPIIPVTVGFGAAAGSARSGTGTTLAAGDDSPAAVSFGTSPRLVASAALPVLSAPPSGGVLSVGDPAFSETTPLAPTTNSASEMLERLTADSSANPEEDRDPATLDEEDVPESDPALVVVQGPGGFPLQLTGLNGTWPGRATLEETPASTDGGCPSAGAICSSHGCASMDAGASDDLARFGVPALGAVSLAFLVVRRDLVRKTARSVKRIAQSPQKRRKRLRPKVDSGVPG